MTKFNYEKGKLVSEVLPSTIIGTYQYDKAGKFQGVSYNDGRKITLSYNPNGSIAGLTTNFRARVQFKTRAASGTKPTTKQAFFAIQNGLSSLIDVGGNECISDVEDECTIIVNGGDGAGGIDDGGDAGGIPVTDDPGGEGGWGGSPTIYPQTGTVYETAAECQQHVCEKAKQDFDNICRKFARPGADRANCFSKSQEYYSYCNPSCERGDWSWLDNWNFIWG